MEFILPKNIFLLLLLTVFSSHTSQKKIYANKSSDWSLCVKAEHPRSWLLSKVMQRIISHTEDRTKEIVEQDLSTAKQWILHLNASQVPFAPEDQERYLSNLNTLFYNVISIFLKKDSFSLNTLFFEYLPLGINIPSLALSNSDNPLKQICKESPYTEYIPFFIYTHQAKLVWDTTYFLKVMIQRYANLDVKTRTKNFEQLLTPCFYNSYSDKQCCYTYGQIAKNHNDHSNLDKKINILLLCLKTAQLKIAKPVLKKLIIEWHILLNKSIGTYNTQHEMYPLLGHCNTVKRSIMSQIESLKKDPELSKNNWNSEHSLPPFLRSPNAFDQWFESVKN